METSNSTAIAPDAKSSHAHHKHYLHNNSVSDQSHVHRHAILSFHSIIIIIVSVISVIVLVALLLLVLMLRRLKSSSEDSHGSSFKDNKSGSSSNNVPPAAPTTAYNYVRDKGVVQVFTYKELETATENFSEGNVIGNGGFGVVYKGVLSDGTVAAIKKLHRDGKQRERAFRMEVDLLSRLHSPQLVELLGYCADQNHRLLISEYMPNDWRTRLIIALDCAMALEFLHEHATPPVIHRDFKCSNVLLDQNFRAKVTDFGLAKMVSDKINGQISTRVLGTTGYLAPEYASTGKLTTKSDVYSYGVVLLELLTGRVPVDPNRPPGEHVLVSWALPRLTSREEAVEMVDPSLQGQYSKKDLIQIAAIAAVCVQPEAAYRPLMTDVVQSLIPVVKNNAAGAISFGSSRFQHQTPSPSH
ncbi:protein kinase domain-containing protein [Citrus sinensis]|uniref:Protein kinase domain-containing protein n=1 Tax=Citrus sinensis TaxID=2711 RepID=A0ACB8KKW0_CITSI|nr:protein kinase domain-containing protein [Citrus sinensis]